MLIEIETPLDGQRWIVHLDAWEVGFNSLEQAQAFVTRLRARIDAPHPWPSGARQMPSQAPRAPMPFVTQRLPERVYD